LKIDLEYPYSKDWDSAYLVVNPEGRRTVILCKNTRPVSSTQYARYLLAVANGRYLTEYEEADHIDENFKNDAIDNLQILSIEEHRQKSIANGRKEKYVECLCSKCNSTFIRRASNVTDATKFCSRECQYNHMRDTGTCGGYVSNVDYSLIREYIDKGMLDTEIASILGVSRSTVLNYRKKLGIASTHFSKRGILEDNLEDIKNRLTLGEKKVSIYKSYGVSKNVFYNFLKREGLF
jgi:predicted transcriptional regulator